MKLKTLLNPNFFSKKRFCVFLNCLKYAAYQTILNLF